MLAAAALLLVTSATGCVAPGLNDGAAATPAWDPTPIAARGEAPVPALANGRQDVESGRPAAPELLRLDRTDLHGFVPPVAGACLPSGQYALPGTRLPGMFVAHEALDFYPGDSCAEIRRGTAVLAMFAGTVIRADLDYSSPFSAEFEEAAARTGTQGIIDPFTLDLYRGRQIWIDHGDGVITRYGHLETIAPAITSGVTVARGQTIGTAGDSGRPEYPQGADPAVHVHVEVRVYDSFLGAGLPVGWVQRAFLRLFDRS